MNIDPILIQSHIRKTTRGMYDISPIFANPNLVRQIIDAFVQRYIDIQFSHITTIDAKGFLIAAPIAYSLAKPLVLLRKPGLLAGGIEKSANPTSALEISTSALSEGDKVLLIDDILASGETLASAQELITRMGAEVVEMAVLLDFPDEGGSARFQRQHLPIYSLCALENYRPVL